MIDTAAGRRVADSYDLSPDPALRDVAFLIRLAMDEIDQLRSDLAGARPKLRCAHCGARLVGVVCADCGTRAVHSNGHE